MTGPLATTLAAVLVLLLPGLALVLPIYLRRPDRPLPEVLILAAGFSLAFHALLLLALTTAGIPYNATSLLVSYGVVAAFGGLLLLLFQREWGLRVRPLVTGHWPWGLALLALALGVFLLRWLPLASLPVPPGVDPVHHVALVDLIARNGAVPAGWFPYWPLEEFSYHFGFHANAAALSLVSGIAPDLAVLLLGPYLTALASLAVYVLIYRITASHPAGFVGALATGVLSVFPGFYLVWGRLPQLAGLVLALLTLAILWDLLREELEPGPVLLGGAFLAATFLTHYRMLVFLVYGLASLLVVRVWQEKHIRGLSLTLKRLAPVLGIAVLLALPWIPILFQSAFAGAVLSPGTGSPQVHSLTRVEGPLSYPSFFWLVSGAVVGGILTALRRKTEFLLFSAWAGLSWFFSTPLLPYRPFRLLDPITWISVSFVFQVSFLATGFLVVFQALRLRRPWDRVAFAAGCTALLVAGVLGTGLLPAQGDVMVTDADRQAFDWIKANLPEDAVFATNVATSPFFGGPEPADAGVWITYFTGRRQLAPGLAALQDSLSAPDYLDLILALPGHEANVGSFDAFLFLGSVGATHLYLGADQTGPMDAASVEASPWYRVVYAEDNVTIAELVVLDPTRLLLSAGRDYSSLTNGYAITREWEENGTVLETYTFQQFRANYSLPMDAPGTYRITVRFVDFVAVDWESEENMSAVQFALDGRVLLEHEYQSTETIIHRQMEVTVEEPGIHTLTVRNRDLGLPFRLSMGTILVEYLGPS